MTTDKIIVTRDGVDMEATPEEEARIRAQWAEIAEKAAAVEAEKKALAAKKQEVLAKLGLTADEVVALLA